MAISKKGSRNISVEGHDFMWRTTGNDGWISIVVWPESNEESIAIANVEYHHDMEKVGDDDYYSQSQLIVTNRVIRELILHVGVEVLLDNHGQIEVGRIEDFYDIQNAIRG